MSAVRLANNNWDELQLKFEFLFQIFVESIWFQSDLWRNTSVFIPVRVSTFVKTAEKNSTLRMESKDIHARRNESDQRKTFVQTTCVIVGFAIQVLQVLMTTRRTLASIKTRTIQNASFADAVEKVCLGWLSIGTWKFTVALNGTVRSASESCQLSGHSKVTNRVCSVKLSNLNVLLCFSSYDSSHGQQTLSL